ncbi:glycoside hydrolase family 18 protein [Granulicella sibirica]|uniref:chitinase n=1 Tax=Granulicella sibirica TaxID=2479048 RepID=A0A4Q0SYJ7_9BACT|nr:glycosyl hydrolase family 18 protein [Granulicella sibirica]RXH56323.1 Chitinase [Granulicella sibirica]
MARSILTLAATLLAATLHAQSPQLTAYFPQWGLYNTPQYNVKTLLASGGAEKLDQLNYAQGFVTDGKCSIADPNADLNFTFSADQSVDNIADQPTQPLRGNLNQLIKLKRKYPKLKLIISLEGKGSDFAADAQPDKRAAFVSSCIDIFLKGNLAPGIKAPNLFDGIDVDWEFPHEEDAANFQALLTEFRTQMNAFHPGLRLNIAVGPSPRMYPGTNFTAISGIVDQIGLMTYDMAGPWSKTTGLLAPLSLSQDQHHGSVANTINAYQQAGIPSQKLLMGIPFYGYGWHQVLEDNNGLFQEGEGIRGDRPYSHILTLIEQSTVYRDPTSQAPWLFDGDIFWTYEDPTSIHAKGAYARDHQLGGLMIWELGEDTPSAALLHASWESLNPQTYDPDSTR